MQWVNGWPWGIEFRIDKLNSFLILIVSFFALYACFFGLRSLKMILRKVKLSFSGLVIYFALLAF